MKGGSYMAYRRRRSRRRVVRRRRSHIRRRRVRGLRVGFRL